MALKFISRAHEEGRVKGGDGGPARTDAADTRSMDALQKRFVACMELRGLRSTSQRRLVSEAFFGFDGHPSLDDVLVRVRRRDPRVGYATVYRTMKLLVECGLANEQRFGGGVTRFEVPDGGRHHDHLICTGCGMIVELEDEALQAVQAQAATRHGFSLADQRCELFGQCPGCQSP